MPTTHQRPIAVLHEHPDWFRPLFSELDRRALPWIRIDAASHYYDPTDESVRYSLVVNRASPSAHIRGHSQTTFYTLQYLRYLESLGVAVVNGSTAYALELSKAGQIALLHTLGLPHPRSLVINSPGQALAAARGLRFPIVLKANIGGSGAGIARYDSPAALARAVGDRAVDLGPDGTALVQELAPLRGGHITRVETLGGRFLYAIDVYPAAGSFDLCPADACQTVGGTELSRGACPADAPRNGLRVQATRPSREIIDQAERISRAASLDVAGIEYLVDDRDGRHYFYDINALSNFVADAPEVIGFDPFVNLVDYLEARSGLRAVMEVV